VCVFFSSYKSFCKVIVYEKKEKKEKEEAMNSEIKKKGSHSMTVNVSKIKEKMSLRI
jgi:hypothetical protein